MIRVVNLKEYEPKDGETLVVIDRLSPLGNPFRINPVKGRHEAIRRYERFFYRQLAHLPVPEYFMRELDRIVRLAKEGDVALGCWCAPKACHGSVVAKYAEQRIKEEG